MNILGTNEVCRACATSSEKRSVYTPLFELSGPIKCVSKDIMEIIEMLQLNFKQNDGLPQKICFNCLKAIAAISEFRKRCEDVQTVLSFYHKSVPTTSIDKKCRTIYAKKIERPKKPHTASGGEKLYNFLLEEIKKEKEEPETRAPFVNGRQFNSKDERLIRRSAIVCLKRIKMENIELAGASCGDDESNKPILVADNGSDACGNQIGNLEQACSDSKANNYMQTEIDLKQVSTDSKANNHIKMEVDLKLQNKKYGAEISEIELLDETFVSEDDSRYGEQDLLLASSDEDIEELNLNENNWQCEFSIDTNDYKNEALAPSKTIENNNIEENTKGETTITKKPKRKMPKREKSQCRFCLRYYQNMLSHFRNCTTRTKNSCKYCDFAFETSSELDDHIEKMHSDGLPACHICFASFENTSKRGDHIRKEHKNIEFKCEKCDRAYSSKKFLQEHMERKHTEIINKECSICKKVIKTEFLFQRHLKQHEMADSLKCQYCGKMFTRTQFKRNHERLHTGETPYLCEICGFGIHSLPDLHAHKKMTHPRDGKEGKPCRLPKKCWTPSRRKTPTEEKRFRCALCPREFGTNYGLDHHLRKHTEDRKFICEQCGNGFKRLVHLKQHERRMHTTDKHFTCPECGKMFYEKHELNKHLPVHQEERPLQCPHCPATFKQQKRLQEHLVIHSSERPYVCHFCGNAYKFVKHLQSHLQTHTMEEIKTLERKLVSVMEESIAANTYWEQEEENIIEEPPFELIEFDYTIENRS